MCCRFIFPCGILFKCCLVRFNAFPTVTLFTLNMCMCDCIEAAEFSAGVFDTRASFSGQEHLGARRCSTSVGAAPEGTARQRMALLSACSCGSCFSCQLCN